MYPNIKVLRSLGEAGLRVPEDVAVIGFDNIDESRFSVPSMSSVDPGRDEIAEIAVELLSERILEKGERRPPRQVKPEFRIVVRESTGGVATPHEPGAGIGVESDASRSGSSAVKT